MSQDALVPAQTPIPSRPGARQASSLVALVVAVVILLLVGELAFQWCRRRGWTAYTTADGLAGNDVEAIAVAPDGALWVYTSGGLSRFDGETWTTYSTTYTEDDRLVNDFVTAAIAVAPDGALWVAVCQHMLYGPNVPRVSRFDGETWTTYTEDDGLGRGCGDAIAVAPDGALWFGISHGVSRFDGDASSTYSSVSPCLMDCGVNALAVDGNGRVWAGYSGQLEVFDPRAGLPARALQVLTRVWRIARGAGIVTSILLVMRWTVLATRSRPATGWRSALLYTAGVGLWAALGAVICGVSTTNWMLFGSPFPAVLGACVGVMIGLFGLVGFVLIQRRAR
jgi:ligand-binding sensor domain-containing protein